MEMCMMLECSVCLVFGIIRSSNFYINRPISDKHINALLILCLSDIIQLEHHLFGTSWLYYFLF